MEDNTLLAIIFALGLLILAGYALKVDQADLDICLSSTTYSEAQCLHEITR